MKNILKKLSKNNKEEKKLYEFLKGIRHCIPSYVLSADDEPYKPTEKLVNISLEGIKNAMSVDVEDIGNSFSEQESKFINTWPGEHYKLLGGLIKVIEPKLVIEIGTSTGASCLTIKKYLPEASKIVTYDVIPWNDFPETGLKESDFDSKLEQRIIDLSNNEEAKSQIDLLKQADIIFVDAAKDGKMERAFCNLFDSIEFDKPPIVLFDDIKFICMLDIWRDIKHPKLDLTGFGHWSGTGIVEWV